MAPLLPDHPIGIDYFAESDPIAKQILKSQIFWLPGDEDRPVQW